MVEKIIKLNCMACGGQLLVDRKKSMVLCLYCGNEYFVRDLLEEFALCPVCESLDRVEKVSALDDSFSFDRLFKWGDDAFDWDDDGWEDDDHHKDPLEASQQRLIWMVVTGLIVMLLLQRVFSRRIDLPMNNFLPIVLVFFAGIGLMLYVKDKLTADERVGSHKADIRQTLLELQEMEYRRLKPLYEDLLFCHRDGVIFLPGEADFSQPAEMKDYLRRHV